MTAMFATWRLYTSLRATSLRAMCVAAGFGLMLSAGPRRAGGFTTGFDSLSEGFHGDVLDIDGIRFFDPVGGAGLTPTFSVDASVSPMGPSISSSNVLGLSAYSMGGGLGFGPVSEFSFAIDKSAYAVRLDLYVNTTFAGNELALEVVRDGTVVGRDVFTSSPFNDHPNPSVEHQRLMVSGAVFDFARLVSRGPAQDGVSFLKVDNVSLTPVPEPATILLVGMALLSVRRSRSKYGRVTARSTVRYFCGITRRDAK